MEQQKGYKGMIVWNKSKEFSISIYALTEKFPQSEIFGLTSQMRRAAVSICSNIAEGSRRGTPKDKRQFFRIAFGSASEIEAQLAIVRELPFGKKFEYQQIDALLDEILRMLNKLSF